MKRQTTTYLALILTVVSSLTGCSPTQPFYLHEDGDLSHLLETATELENPDVYESSLEEVNQAHAPLSLSNPDFEEIWDLTLEECISIALNNSKIIRTVGGTAAQRGGFEANILSSASEGTTSVYDSAITETTTGTQAHAVDGTGSRPLPRGAVRANQIGGVEDALSEFDAQVFSNFSYSHTDRPVNVEQGNVVQSFFASTSKDANFLAAISKRTATGAVFTFRNQLAIDIATKPHAP